MTACDAGGPDPLTAAVVAAGIPIEWSHDPSHVRGADGTAAGGPGRGHQGDHLGRPRPPGADGRPRRSGIQPESVQQVIADAAATHGRRLVAVTGTHGKSTTSGWLLDMLVGAGADPSGFVGAMLPAAIAGPQRGVARIGAGRDFIVEADEYAGNFDPYRPDITVLISAEWDHPDVFADEAAVVAAFAAWIGRSGSATGEPPTLVANVGDRGVRSVLEALAGWPGRRIGVQLLADGETARDGAHDRRHGPRRGRRRHGARGARPARAGPRTRPGPAAPDRPAHGRSTG